MTSQIKAIRQSENRPLGSGGVVLTIEGEVWWMFQKVAAGVAIR